MKANIKVSCTDLVYENNYLKVFAEKKYPSRSFLSFLAVGCSHYLTASHVPQGSLTFIPADVFTSYYKPLNLCCTFINLQENIDMLNISCSQIAHCTQCLLIT